MKLSRRSVKSSLKGLLPPLVAIAAKRLLTLLSPWLGIQPEFELVPEGWARAAVDPAIQGWDVETVREVYAAKWSNFQDYLRGNGPLGIAHEAQELDNTDLVSHNTVVSFAYVLALAAHNKTKVSLLDWGGGLGHYALIARAVLPNIHLDYHCKEVACLSTYGQTLLPEATFYTSDTDYQDRRFDLVMASGALQYAQDWRQVLRHLIAVTQDYLYLTRLPVHDQAPTYVMIQRPHRSGYGTAYLSWCWNREELLAEILNQGMVLVREFLTGEQIEVRGAPVSPCQFRGFLFRPVNGGQQ